MRERQERQRERAREDVSTGISREELAELLAGAIVATLERLEALLAEGGSSRRGSEPLEDLWTIKQVAERLQCTERTVHRHVASGRLRSVLVGKARRIPASALRVFVRGGAEAEASSSSASIEAAIAAIGRER